MKAVERRVSKNKMPVIVRDMDDDEATIIMPTTVVTYLYLDKTVIYSETGAANFGYRDTSFSLALSVVKCQEMFAAAWLRSVSHAASS